MVPPAASPGSRQEGVSALLQDVATSYFHLWPTGEYLRTSQLPAYVCHPRLKHIEVPLGRAAGKRAWKCRRELIQVDNNQRIV